MVIGDLVLLDIFMIIGAQIGVLIIFRGNGYAEYYIVTQTGGLHGELGPPVLPFGVFAAEGNRLVWDSGHCRFKMIGGLAVLKLHLFLV